MKKIFTLIATALLSAGASAQISLDFSSYTATSDAKSISISSDGFKVEAASDASGAAFDNSSSNFAFAATDNDVDWAFSSATDIRWKPGTGMGIKSTRWMTITVPSAGKLQIYARNSNSSNTDRTMTLIQNDKDIYGPTVVKDADKFSLENGKANNCFPIISADVEAGTITVKTSGAVNFYGFKFIPDGPSAIDAVAAGETVGNSKWYNMQGQEVQAPTKGLFIKDGKKYLFN